MEKLFKFEIFFNQKIFKTCSLKLCFIYIVARINHFNFFSNLFWILDEIVEDSNLSDNNSVSISATCVGASVRIEWNDPNKLELPGSVAEDWRTLITTANVSVIDVSSADHTLRRCRGSSSFCGCCNSRSACSGSRCSKRGCRWGCSGRAAENSS